MISVWKKIDKDYKNYLWLKRVNYVFMKKELRKFLKTKPGNYVMVIDKSDDYEIDFCNDKYYNNITGKRNYNEIIDDIVRYINNDEKYLVNIEILNIYLKYLKIDLKLK